MNILLLTVEQVRIIHGRLALPEHLRGEYEERPVGAVLARLQNRLNYGVGISDVFDVAACYAAFISVGHSFRDGNKRTALAAMDACLALNGINLEYGKPDQDPLYDMIIACADKRLDEQTLATYLRSRYMQSKNAFPDRRDNP